MWDVQSFYYLALHILKLLPKHILFGLLSPYIPKTFSDICVQELHSLSVRNIVRERVEIQVCGVRACICVCDLRSAHAFHDS